MRLYATVSSERAKKGQGGNKEIIVDLLAGSRDDSRIIARVKLLANGDVYEMTYQNMEAAGNALQICQTGMIETKR